MWILQSTSRKIYSSLLKDRRSIGKGKGLNHRGHLGHHYLYGETEYLAIYPISSWSRLSFIPSLRGSPAISSSCIADRFIAFHGFAHDGLADAVQFTVSFAVSTANRDLALRADNWPASHSGAKVDLTILRFNALCDHD